MTVNAILDLFLNVCNIKWIFNVPLYLYSKLYFLCVYERLFAQVFLSNTNLYTIIWFQVAFSDLIIVVCLLVCLLVFYNPWRL